MTFYARNIIHTFDTYMTKYSTSKNHVRHLFTANYIAYLPKFSRPY